MLNFKKYILKSESFNSDKERLKGMILSLMLLVSIIIMTLDIYGNFSDTYMYIVDLEIGVLLLLLFTYFMLPRFISLERSVKIFTSLITALILAALTLPGYNYEFTLFALAIIPASIFFLLGLKNGIRWSIVIIIVIFLTTLNAYVEWVAPVFNVDLLLQVSAAYIIITIFYYTIERERVSYEEQLNKTIKEKNRLIKEKSVLLKEVHHRAKNNLQTIMGILESQALRTKDNGCRKLLTSQRTRLQSMSLLHEFLAFDTDCEKVNMAEYLSQIINNIQKSTQHTITKNINAFTLEMSEAVHIGLFLNEAVSNSIEHAYGKDEIGNIDVILECNNETCILTVKDYGIGFNQKENNNSLGLLLMQDISQFFTDGNMLIDFSEGTKIVVEFKV